MKQGVKLFILLLVCILVIVGATSLYNYLKEKNDIQPGGLAGLNDPTASQPPETQTPADTNLPTESSSAAAEELPEATPPLAPDFTFTDMQGNTVNFNDFLGKPIIINFWATWCGPCQHEMPAFEAVYKKYGEDVNFIMMNLTDGARDTKEKVAEFIKENEYSFPTFLDIEMNGSAIYGIRAIPTTVFIDKNGGYRGQITQTMDEEFLIECVEELISMGGN